MLIIACTDVCTLTGSQENHRLLRLLTAIELILHPNTYDTKQKFNNFLNDIRIVTSPYENLVRDAIEDGSYSEMGQIYALSTDLALPIMSYFLINNELSDAFTRLVRGRSVTDTESPLSVMWSSASLPTEVKEAVINHFIPLVDRKLVSDTSTVSTGAQDVISKAEIDNENVKLDALSTHSVSHDVSSVFDIDNAIVELDTLSTQSVVHDVSSITSVSDDECKTLTNDVVNDETTGNLVNGFLTTDRTIELLTSGMTGKETIPVGVKDNVYYVIDNTRNAHSKSTGKHSDFSDDCGIWDTSKGTSPKTYYVKFVNTFRQTYLRLNLFCYRKKTKGQIDYIPYDPQRDSSMIFHIFMQHPKKTQTIKNVFHGLLI